MSTKRVILANNSRLVREMLHRVIDKADSLEVVQDIPDQRALDSAIERFAPEWVILSSPQRGDATDNWLDTGASKYPSVRYIVLSPDHSNIRVRLQNSPEEDISRLSVDDFIHVLERDLQHT